MAVTLHIHFSGLCLFVPEPGMSGKGKMHVLMPTVDEHLHGADRHFPVLGVPDTYLGFPDSTETNYVLFPLRDSVLDLGTTSDAALDLCPQIPDLKEVTSKPVNPNLLKDNEHGRLIARVSLGAGKMAGVTAGACAEWKPGVIQRIPHILEWTVPDPDLTLVLKHFDGTIKTKLPALTPKGDVIRIFIYHVPFGEVPGQIDPSAHRPRVGDEPAHFAAYYNLFGGPVQRRFPRFWSDEADCAPLDTSACPAANEPPRGRVAFNCMLARTA